MNIERSDDSKNKTIERSQAIGEDEIDDIVNKFDLDENGHTLFRPLTEGLGFNKKEEVKRPIVQKAKIKQNRTSLATRPITPSHTMSNRPVGQFKYQQEVSLESVGLKTPQMTENRKVTVSTGSEQKEAEQAQANSVAVLRFMAFCLDILFINGVLGGISFALIYFSNISWQILLGQVPVTEFVAFCSAIFILFYFLYFSLLDTQRTIGKAIFDLQAEKEGKAISVFDAFIFSFANLLNLVLLGIPALVGWPGNVLGIKVIKRENII